MQPGDCLWRPDFLAALRLLAQAAARQPYGVEDPVLSASTALALYTGDLWPAVSVEVRATDRRALIAELMGLGFRYAGRSSSDSGGLRHPACRFMINVLQTCQGLPPAERANVLTVTLDLAGDGNSAATAPQLRVLGIEDLIAVQTVSWLAHEPQCDDVTTLIRTLVALGERGVGGRFRPLYLQHRLAWTTGGAVVLDPVCGTGDTPGPRAMTLAAMQAAIEAWRIRSGLWFPTAGMRAPDASPAPSRVMLYRNDSSERGGQGARLPSNVVFLERAPDPPCCPR